MTSNKPSFIPLVGCSILASLVLWLKEHEKATNSIHENIPENVRQQNENDCCYMMAHGHPKICTPCFPENQSKYGVCVKSSSIHINSLQSQPEIHK